MFGKRLLKTSRLSFYTKRRFARAFMPDTILQTGLKDNSFVLNLYRGKIEASQVFPYPDILTVEQRDTLKNLVPPVEKFFAEFNNTNSFYKSDKLSDDSLKRLWELGAFSLQVPKNLGGMGLSNTQYARLVEIVGAHDLGVGITLGSQQSIGYKGILLYGTDEQKQKYLPKVTSGQFAAFCLTEPSCGSDVCSMSSKAELSPDGKHYVLNGSKVWVCGGTTADIMTVFAKTSEKTISTKPGDDITAFIVERSFGGISSGSVELKPNQNSKAVEITYKDVKVPIENVLGGVGNGFKVAMNILNNGRFGMAASLAGTMKTCINKAITFATPRKLFGERFDSFGSIKERFARMAMKQYVTESMAYMISSNMDKGSQNYSVEAAISKCFASEAAWFVCDEAIQIMGGTGFLQETGLENILGDLRTFKIFEGTNDILRLYIALTGVQYATPYVEEYLKSLWRPREKGRQALAESWDNILRVVRLKSYFTMYDLCNIDLIPCAFTFSKCVDRFCLAVTWMITKYGNKIDTEQFILNRLADVSVDLYSSACVLSRASSALHKRLPTAQHEKLLTEAWIFEASKRINGNLDAISSRKHREQFERLNAISGNICQPGQVPTGNPLNL